MENYLEYHYKKYPKSEVQDYIKLVYQTTFGTEHMISDPTKSLSYLKEEISNLSHVEFYEDLYDYISNDYIRVNLRVYKQYNLNVNILNETFINTSQIFIDNDKTFIGELSLLKKFLIKNGHAVGELDYYYESIKDNNYHSVHHSQTYHRNYAPAYRVIHQKFLNEELRYYQVRHFLDSFDKSKINFFALEGKTTSGKGEISNLLLKDNDVTVIHTKDFYDSSDNETGINSLRLIKEIINPAVLNKQLKYKRYNSSSKTFEEVIIEKTCPIVVIEGVYSSNPMLEEYYKGVIYLHINEDLRQDRLLMKPRLLLSKFIGEWIPKENNYYSKYNPFKRADIIV